MDGPRQELLAGAGLAGNQHGDVARGDAPGGAHQVQHGLGRAYEAELLLGQGIGPQRRPLTFGDLGGVQRAGVGDEALER